MSDGKTNGAGSATKAAKSALPESARLQSQLDDLLQRRDKVQADKAKADKELESQKTAMVDGKGDAAKLGAAAATSGAFDDVLNELDARISNLKNSISEAKQSEIRAPIVSHLVELAQSANETKAAVVKARADALEKFLNAVRAYNDALKTHEKTRHEFEEAAKPIAPKLGQFPQNITEAEDELISELRTTGVDLTGILTSVRYRPGSLPTERPFLLGKAFDFGRLEMKDSALREAFDLVLQQVTNEELQAVEIPTTPAKIAPRSRFEQSQGPIKIKPLDGTMQEVNFKVG